RADENDERIAEALELRRQDQVNEDRRQQEGAEKTAALRAKLPRLPRVVDREPLRENAPGFVLEEAQRPIERNGWRNHPLHAHGIELLEFFQLARLRRRPQARERRERN